MCGMLPLFFSLVWCFFFFANRMFSSAFGSVERFGERPWHILFIVSRRMHDARCRLKGLENALGWAWRRKQRWFIKVRVFFYNDLSENKMSGCVPLCIIWFYGMWQKKNSANIVDFMFLLGLMFFFCSSKTHRRHWLSFRAFVASRRKHT